MVCRATPGSSVPLGLAKIESGLDDAQVQSLIHQLRHECPDEEPASREVEQQEWDTQRRQLERVTHNHEQLRPQRRDGMLAKLDAAQQPPPEDVRYAMRHIRTRAGQSARQLGAYVRAHAALSGSTEVETRRRFEQLRAQAPRGRRERASAEQRDQWRGLPTDPATRHAMQTLLEQRLALPAGPAVIDDAQRQPVDWPGEQEIRLVGYNAESRRLELTLRGGQRLAYRDVPPGLVDAVRRGTMGNSPDQVWRSDLAQDAHRYPSGDLAEAYGTRRRCHDCGRWASVEHRCLGPTGAAVPEAGSESPAPAAAPATLRTVRAPPADDPFAAPGAQPVLLRTYELTEVALALRAAGPTGLRIPLTADVDRVGRHLGRDLAGGEVSGDVIARRDEEGRVSVAAASTLQCDCTEYGEPGGCRHLRASLAALRPMLAYELEHAPAWIGAIAEQLAAQRAPAAPPSLTDLTPAFKASSTVSYRDDPAAFAGDVLDALERGADSTVAWRDQSDVPVLAGFGADRRFGVELEFDVDPESPEFGDEPGDDGLDGVEEEVEEVEYNGPHEVTKPGPGGQVVTVTRTGPYLEERAFLAFLGTEDPPHEEVVRARVGQALEGADLTCDSERRGYHDTYSEGYPTNAWGGWSYEEDSSVTGGEVISPILSDTGEAWESLREACRAITVGGGLATARTGSHIHVSAPEFLGDADRINRLLGLVYRYQDVLQAMADAGEGRIDRGHVEPLSAPPAAGYLTVGHAHPAASRRRIVNIGHVPAVRPEDDGDAFLEGQECRVEFRLWDGSLELGRIQAQVLASTALVGYASRTPHHTLPPPPVEHRWCRPGDPDFASFSATARELIDLVAVTDDQKRQLAALWAASTYRHTACGSNSLSDRPPGETNIE